jgi:hypothetical protein
MHPVIPRIHRAYATRGWSATTICMSFSRAQATCGGTHVRSPLITWTPEGAPLLPPGRRCAS